MSVDCAFLMQCFTILGAVVVAHWAYIVASKLWYFITTFCFKRTLDASKYGKWTVVTGASDGIGKQFALQFAENGQNIILISRSLHKLETLAEEIELKYGVRTKCVLADFRGGAEIYEGIAEVVAGLDVGVLVNNVGSGTAPCKFGECNIDQEVDEIIPTNVASHLRMSRMVLPGMTQRKRGLIINVSSGAAISPFPHLSIYGATKAFMDYFSSSTAFEYRNDGIRMVSILPFMVSTNMHNNVPPSFWIREPGDFVRNAMSAVASGRERTHGCWQHDLQGWIGRNLPLSIHQALLKYGLNQVVKQR